MNGVPNNFLPLMNAFLMYKFTENVQRCKIMVVKLMTVLTLPADASPKVVVQLEWILNGNTGGIPHLLKLGEWSRLSDGHNESSIQKEGLFWINFYFLFLLVIPISCIKVEKPNPEFPKGHPVPVVSPPLTDHLPTI